MVICYKNVYNLKIIIALKDTYRNQYKGHAILRMLKDYIYLIVSGKLKEVKFDRKVLNMPKELKIITSRNKQKTVKLNLNKFNHVKNWIKIKK